MARRLIALAFTIAGFSVLTHSQSAGSNVRLTLTEGTSMAAALSPDGRTIVIDLLGALWTLNAEGGAATRILDDGYDARMPAWSPDGRRIAFQAYRSSTWNIWTINRDGTELRQETSGPFDDREPHWSPDGTRLAFSSDRSGNYDVWTLSLATSAVEQVTRDSANDYMPAWSPDGRALAFVSDRQARGIYAVAPDGSGERLVHAEAGVAAAPSWNADGKTLAYTVTAADVARLMIAGNNIADTAEDVFPFRASWRSGTELLYTADGKIKTRSARGGPSRTIEFAANINFTRAAFTPKARELSPTGTQTARGIMRPAVSPDGAQVVFAALSDLWLAPTTAGDVTPTRLTHDAFVDTDPSWSPDGRRIAFSSDRDGSMDLWVHELPTKAERRVARRAMFASWSPDGTRIAFLDPESQLQIVDVATGQTHRAHERLNEPGRPSWSPDGRAVVMSALRPYSTRFREGTNQVLRISIEASSASATGKAETRWFEPLPHKSTGMREDSGPVWSSDGLQMAAIVDGYLSAFPVTRDGSPVGTPRRLSSELAGTPSWTRDSRHLLYQTVDGLRLVDLNNGAEREIRPRVTWTPQMKTGTLTIHAGRLVDGRTAAARENVDVVVEGNRIARVEPHQPGLHTGRLVDATDRTVLPGLIESHAHLSKSYGEVLGRIWLSFGITSVRNPAAHAFEAHEDREALDAGVRIGPRVFLAGEPFDGTRIYYPGGAALDGGVQLAAQLARAQALQFDFIKTYVRLPDALQQRVIDASHRMGLPVTSHEIYPAVAYGADGVEHIRGTSRRGFSPKMSELRRSYRDVIDLLAASKMTLTPTIGIQGGHQVLTLRDGSWMDDTRLQQLFPPSAMAAGRALRARPVDTADLAQREALVAPQEKMVAQVVRAGGRVIAGTDAPINPYGLTLLMELEHYVRGGLTPAEAIRTATSVPAEAMGLASQIGAIDRGMLADIVVVDGNPLVDITDLRRVRQVIKDGVLFDMDALLRRPNAPSSSRLR